MTVRIRALRRRPRGLPSGGARGTDSGYVTAELALSLPAVALLLALVLTASALVLDQLRCVDAARAAARAASRGDAVARIVAQATDSAPPGAEVQVDPGPPVRVTVRGPQRPLLPGQLRARAAVTAPTETTARGPGWSLR